MRDCQQPEPSAAEEATNTRLLDRFYGIFIWVGVLGLTVGVPFVFERKLLPAVVVLWILALATYCRRILRRGVIRQSLWLFAGLLWPIMAAFSFLGASNGFFILGISMILAVVVGVRAAVLYGASLLIFWLAALLSFGSGILVPYFQLRPAVQWFNAALTLWIILLPVAELVGNLRRETAERRQAEQRLQQDIAARMRVEADLVAAREAALAGSRAKSEFLATISHEIRTPMNGVLGMTQLLMDTPLDPDQRSYAQTIGDCANVLMKTLNDVLQYAQIDAGTVATKCAEVDLHGLLAGLEDAFRASAHAKGLAFRLDIGADVPARVHIDGGCVRQVLGHLCGNAVKFTERGEIVLRVLTVPGGSLRFEVRDTGIGIAADKSAGLFDAFAQADASTTRRHGGTGLGLAISKRLVDLMGGRIGVDAPGAGGAVFWFEIPVPAPAVAAAAA